MTEKHYDRNLKNRQVNRLDNSPEWIRWLGFVSGMIIFLIALLFPNDWLGSKPDSADIFITLGLIILPSISAAILSLARKFWILLVPGAWFIALGFTFRIEKNPASWSLIFVVAATMLFVTPFLSWTFKQKPKQITQTNSEKTHNNKSK